MDITAIAKYDSIRGGEQLGENRATHTSLLAAGKDISAAVIARKVLDRFADCAGKETEDQNGLFGLAMYHCLAASSIELDSCQDGMVIVNSRQEGKE